MTLALRKITELLVKVGRIVCQMIFLVVDTDNYDLLLGLDFLIKIGTIVDVEKGLIQVRNGLEMEMEVLPLNVVNMLQVLERFEEEKGKIRKELFNRKIGQLQINSQANLFRSLDFDDLNEESSSDEDVVEYEGKVKDDPQEILLNLGNQIEELRDQGVDLIVEKEVPMLILNVILQEQHQNILEWQFIEDDDYVDWIKCAPTQEDARIQQRLRKNIEPKVHLYPVQISNDWIEGGKRWVQIKSKIRLYESLNEEQQKQLWDLLEEFQGVFAWHKGELGQCFMGEHSIDTQGLPPYHMIPRWLSYWEEVEVN